MVPVARVFISPSKDDDTKTDSRRCLQGMTAGKDS